ncbi:MAG TPA: hypothetical protein VHG89_05145 [Verrucomicrobiae bacterium]|nr:hypothetical protein [Verrucomicrobiae bacterium]
MNDVLNNSFSDFDLKKNQETQVALLFNRRMAESGKSEEVLPSEELHEACCGEELRFFWADDGRYISVCRRCGKKYSDSTRVRYGSNPWIGVDLDGTLAHDLGNKTLDEIGSPIMPMLNRVKKWVAEGRTVKIFTARASSAKQVVAIKKWLAKHGLPDLEVTNTKDMRMIELWDDRCVQVTTNLGEPVDNGRKSSLKPNRLGNMKDFNQQGALSGLVSRIKFFLTL